MMLRRNERILDNIPVGSLGIIALDGCTEMGNKVNDYIVKWRHEDGHEDNVDNLVYNFTFPRFQGFFHVDNFEDSLWGILHASTFFVYNLQSWIFRQFAARIACFSVNISFLFPA